MLKVKHSARLPPAMAMAVMLQVARDAFNEVGADAIITSAIDSKHGNGSLHYVGHALDFRTKHIEKAQASLVADIMAIALGDDYDVVLESDHLHCEFQPKLPVN